MENFNINEVDFFNLDIDKYLNWLLSKYKRFASLKIIVLLDDTVKDYQIRKYFANSHYIATRGETLPDTITELYAKKINHYTKQRDEYKPLHIEVAFFESVKYEKQKEEIKEYGFFTREELQNINIDISNLLFWIEAENEQEQIKFIEDKRSRTPQPDKIFYQKELTNILTENRFNYLPLILNGDFIYNLDNDKNAFAFSSEIDKIKTAIYLTSKIKGETPKHSITKPIQWTGNLNTLVTIFNELLTANLFKNEFGAKENIKRVLINNFVNTDGLELSKHSIDEIFNPSKMKTDKKTVDLLKPLLEYLQKK